MTISYDKLIEMLGYFKRSVAHYDAQRELLLSDSKNRLPPFAFDLLDIDEKIRAAIGNYKLLKKHHKSLEALI
jgi:hypothetical protein